LCDIFRDNAEDCAFLAERAEDGEVKRALKRMEEAWRTLAQEQNQLDNKRWSTKKATPVKWRDQVQAAAHELVRLGYHI
jgi:ferric-dicitrate binding protein FerR (iron transport regulator)